MYQLSCINCKQPIFTNEMKVGVVITCSCGCSQKCLHVNVENNMSNWRVVNPFDFEDRRDK